MISANRSPVPGHARRRIRMFFVTGLVLCVAACWDFKKVPPSSVKQDLCDMVDKWYKTAKETCDAQDGTARTNCLHDLSKQVNEMYKAKLDAYNAYLNCDKDAWKAAIGKIKSVLDAVKTVGGLVSNIAAPLGPDGKVGLGITMTQRGGGSSSYDINPGSTIQYSMVDGETVTAEVAGVVKFGPFTQQNGTLKSTVTQFDLVLSTESTTTISLYGQGPNSVTLVPTSGTNYGGTLKCVVNFAFDEIGSTFFTLTLPIRTTSILHPSFTISTDSTLVPNRMLFPETQLEAGVLYEFVIMNDLAINSTSVIHIGMGAPNAPYTLYRSPTLAYPTVTFGGQPGWWLTVADQVVEASGYLDSDGNADVSVTIPNDPDLIGTFRGYQAVVGEVGSQVITAPAGEFIGSP